MFDNRITMHVAPHDMLIVLGLAGMGGVEMIPEPFRDLIRKSVDAVNDEFTRALDESREAAEKLLRQMKEEGESNG